MTPPEEPKDLAAVTGTEWWSGAFSVAVGIYVVHLC